MKSQIKIYLFALVTFAIYIGIAAFFGLALFGCGSTLRDDESPIDSVTANYPSLELWGCGDDRRMIGAMWCEPERANAFVYLALPGTLTVSGCGLSESKFYKQGSTAVIEVSKVRTVNGCIVSAYFKPEFDGAKVLSGLHGVIVVNKSEVEIQKRHLDQLTFLKLRVARNDGDLVTVEFDSDRGHFAFIERVENEQVTVRIDEQIGNKLGFESIIGSVDNADFEVFLVNYDKSYPRLPIPVVEFSKGSLIVRADYNVAAIDLDGVHVFKREHTFKEFDPMRSHVLRVGTVKGRQAVGTWNPIRQEFLWSN